jgi:hypothetical protein
MSAPALVSDPGQVTADWLTDVLAQAGALAGGAVTGFDAAAIGTGSVGATLRYRLRYAPGTAAGPASVVVKFAAAEEASRAAGVATESQTAGPLPRGAGGVRDQLPARCLLGGLPAAQLGGLVMAVIAGMLASRTERSDAMFVTMANRHAIQARDLGAAEFLS